MSEHGAQNPHHRTRGQNPRGLAWGQYQGDAPPYEFQATYYPYAQASASNRQHFPPLGSGGQFHGGAPTSQSALNPQQFPPPWPPNAPSSMYWQQPYEQHLRQPQPYWQQPSSAQFPNQQHLQPINQEHMQAINQQLLPSPPPPLPSYPCPSPPPPPSSSPPSLLHGSLLGKRHAEDEQGPGSKRIKMEVTLEYMPVMDFFGQHPALEPYGFDFGSSYGSIPPVEHPKTTHLAATVLDGFVEYFCKANEANRSHGGDYEVSDMLVCPEDPLHVTIGKAAEMEGSNVNLHKDLLKLVDSVVKPVYVAIDGDGNRICPAYVADFIDRVEGLSPESRPEEWERELWVIRHHPLLMETAKRRLILEDYYKFYKTMSPRDMYSLIRRLMRRCHPRWHVLIVPGDKFLRSIYWKKQKAKPPAHYETWDYSEYVDRNEEDHHHYPFTSDNFYLAVFLRHFIVHGPEELLASGIQLEELELIIAYHFPKLLPALLEELHLVPKKHGPLPKEILDVCAERRSVSRRAPE